jgi:Ca2+-binding RTX toxin-like protein
VESSVDYTLSTTLENLALTGSTALDGTGNTSSNVLVGNMGDNTLSGLDGDDDLQGGGGNDTLIGGNGNDTYRFDRGGGSDTVVAIDTDGSIDKLILGQGIASDQLWFKQTGADNADLEIDLIGTTDKIVVSAWFTDPSNQLDEIDLADGTYATANDIQQLTSAMAAFNPPAVGTMSIDPDTKQQLNPVLAASWHSSSAAA